MGYFYDTINPNNCKVVREFFFTRSIRYLHNSERTLFCQKKRFSYKNFIFFYDCLVCDAAIWTRLFFHSTFLSTAHCFVHFFRNTAPYTTWKRSSAASVIILRQPLNMGCIDRLHICITDAYALYSESCVRSWSKGYDAGLRSLRSGFDSLRARRFYGIRGVGHECHSYGRRADESR